MYKAGFFTEGGKAIFVLGSIPSPGSFFIVLTYIISVRNFALIVSCLNIKKRDFLRNNFQQTSIKPLFCVNPLVSREVLRIEKYAEVYSLNEWSTRSSG